MNLVSVPTSTGEVFVNTDRILHVSTWKGAKSRHDNTVVILGTEIRFAPGGFGGGSVYTTLSLGDTVNRLRDGA